MRLGRSRTVDWFLDLLDDFGIRKPFDMALIGLIIICITVSLILMGFLIVWSLYDMLW